MREVLLTTLVIPIMLLIFSQIIIATLGFSFMMKQQQQQTQTQNRRLLQTTTTTSLFLSSDEEKKDDDNNSLYQENREDSSGQVIANNMTLLPFQTVPLKMIVFDKDGTLGDDSGSLKKWMNHMTDCFTECLRKKHYSESEISTIIQSLHNRLGWDNSIQNVISSAPLAVGTWEESIETCCNVAELCGLEPRTLPRQWHAKLNNVHGSDPPIIPNLIEMIQSCRDLGLIVAICTSDDRTSTDSAIRNWNISDLIDYSICGDEVGTTPKPSSIPLEILCKRVLGSIKPQECIIVGDTVGDTGMARNAKAGLCIGVLSGSGNEKQLLETGANIIVPNVGHIPELLLNLLIVGRSGSK